MTGGLDLTRNAFVSPLIVMWPRDNRMSGRYLPLHQRSALIYVKPDEIKEGRSLCVCVRVFVSSALNDAGARRSLPGPRSDWERGRGLQTPVVFFSPPVLFFCAAARPRARTHARTRVCRIHAAPPRGGRGD